MVELKQANRNKNVETIYPLSPLQQGILFHTLMMPDAGIYIEQYSCILEGDLNLSAFETAWRQVIQRHAVLRTVFAWENIKQPVQIVLKSVSFFLQHQDWQYLNTDEQKEQLQTFLQQDKTQPFSLNQPPLMRCTLIQLERTTYYLVWSFHHLLFDAWCVSLLFKEVFALYDANNENSEIQLASPIPYRNYIAWLQQQDIHQAEKFWRQTLKGFITPTTFIQETKQAINPKQQLLTLPSSKTTELVTFSRQNRLTLNTIIQSAWAILLSRYSGETDVLFGVTVSGRSPSLRGVESIIGLLINTLPFRVSFSENTKLIPWLKGLQIQQIEQEQYSYTPLTDIQKWSDVPQCQSLFNSILVFENAPIESSLFNQANGLQIRDVQGISWTNYPLTITVIPGSELTINITYDRNRFQDEIIGRMLGHLETLLTAMVIHPEAEVIDLPLLTPEEKEKILFEGNRTEKDYASDRCLHQLFEGQAEKTPDAIAVIFQDQHLTYRQLNQKANQLAHYLKTLGVQPETLIGICVERSLEMVIGLLGILKAGGAYIPLDPNYPSGRLTSILKDAQAEILLTQTHLNDLFRESTARIIDLDIASAEIDHHSGENPETEVTPNHLAYLIYTSGSTGQPKGVQIEHHCVVNFLYSMRGEPGMTGQDRLLAVTTISFDIAALEIYLPLSVGATVIIATSEMASDGIQLLESLTRNRITMMQATPATWRMLLNAGWEDNQPLKILCGGEALNRELSQQLIRRGTVWNLYGPTETTIWATIAPVQSSPLPIEPIGRPISNTQVYILDSNLQPVPIGVVGELHIGGVQLARGYLNRPQLTQQKFIPNPFGRGRLYKTGDLARYLNDGNIEYLGRIDHQIKLRGFRIELGEIEAVLAGHLQIQEAVVIARESASGDKQLIAYIVSSGELSDSQIRPFLQEKLPFYMIPAAFVFLESFPLTPNGKIDREALPEPQQAKGQKTPLQTPTQELLAQIWSDILKVEKVGLEDNFFQLGGHSLLATQVVSRIRNSFDVELPVRSLFEYPTLETLSRQIEQNKRQPRQLPAIEAVGREGELPLSFAQRRLWFLNQLQGDSDSYNIPIALQIEGKLNLETLENSWREIVRRHEVLRTNFISRNGIPSLLIHSDREVSIHYFDLTHLTKAEQTQQIISSEVAKPFNLEEDSLGRVTLITLSEHSSILVITLHHIIADGWSIGVLVKELSTLYQGLSLSELPIQYADFAHWQRLVLQGDSYRQQLQYWIEQLDDSPATLNLPYDRPRTSLPLNQGATLTLQLDKTLSTQLKSLTQKSGVTLFMLLLAAFGVLLSRYSGQQDIIIGSPIANRNRSEIEPLIGCFVNSLPLRLNLEHHPTFEALLKQVRQTCLDAYAHQDIPFEKLVEELQLERNLTQNPLFQVMFVLQNAPLEDLNLEQLQFTPIRVHNQTAKLDLSLTLEETEDGLKGEWEYNSHLFNPETIQRLSRHFQNLLQGIIENPKQAIGKLPLLNEAETQQILIEWNHTQKEYPNNRCIHQLFEEQVEKTPDAIALVFQEQNLTYRQLNEKANQLAHYLQSLGIQPETLVGICVERSLEMVIGLLGILKSGAAYVPLDPDYPASRLTHMITDADCPIILTQKDIKGFLSDYTGHLIALDEDRTTISQQLTDNPHTSLTPDNVIYTLYTSGSTGQPKGVMNTHRGVTNRLLWMQETYQLNSQDNILQKTPFSFDVSVWEFFWPLMMGAKLILAIPGGHRDSAYLVQLIQQQQITTIHFVPSMLRQFLSETGVENCKSLKRVICSGEALSYDLNQQFFQKLSCQLENLYGPTEAAVDVSYWSCQANHTRTSVPIGRAIANTQLYILDRYLQPVPIGVAGELHIGGVQLAEGYLNRPELTAEKFIPNPFGDGRLYRTGDLARYLGDGNIEYLGRMDNQVKLRGFRIELGEIESLLLQHPQIREAVVILDGDSTDNSSSPLTVNTRLIAYVVCSDGQTQLTPIKTYLLERLPAYMVPSVFIFLEALPLLPNGKIDRRSLPKFDRINTELEKNFVAPRNATEQLLSEIWGDVLRLDKVGIYDNFFDLGGHSLLATQVLSRVRETFQIEISLRSLFELPKIADFSELINAKQLETADIELLESILTEMDELSNEEIEKLLKD